MKGGRMAVGDRYAFRGYVHLTAFDRQTLEAIYHAIVSISDILETVQCRVQTLTAIIVAVQRAK